MWSRSARRSPIISSLWRTALSRRSRPAARAVIFGPCTPEPPGDVAPIGRPIANHQLHVVDRSLAPQPVGIPGELLLGGPGLARGYPGRPGPAAAVVSPAPCGAAPGERLYRTGDLVRRLADGTVHYLGR